MSYVDPREPPLVQPVTLPPLDVILSSVKSMSGLLPSPKSISPITFPVPNAVPAVPPINVLELTSFVVLLTGRFSPR